MTIPLGRYPLPLRECWSPRCKTQIIFLANHKVGRSIGVNLDTLSQEEVQRIQETGRAFDVDYDPKRHQLHTDTCKDRDYRPPEKPRGRPRKANTAPGQATLFEPPREPWETD